MKITFALVAAVVVAYILGAKFPALAQKIGIA
jgi:hypothetical protein